MFLANGSWDQLIRQHSQEMLITGTQEVDDTGTREGDRDQDDDQSADDEESYDSAENRDTMGSLGPKRRLVEPEEQILLDEQLNQLVARLCEIKFTIVEPRAFDAAFLKVVPNLRLLPSNNHILSLQTSIRDRNSPREDFVFNADRLIRLVIEEGLNQLPSKLKKIVTPTGGAYRGAEFHKSNCGISIVRSGEAMEKALRDCCRSIRIGKILIQSDEETHIARVLYAKLPADISLRKVLLLYPIMSTGNTVVKAIKVLKKSGVKEANIILINLFSTPIAIRALASRFKELTIQTTEIHPVAPAHFGQKYFGTD